MLSRGFTRCVAARGDAVWWRVTHGAPDVNSLKINIYLLEYTRISVDLKNYIEVIFVL